MGFAKIGVPILGVPLKGFYFRHRYPYFWKYPNAQNSSSGQVDVPRPVVVEKVVQAESGLAKPQASYPALSSKPIRISKLEL